MSKNQVTGHRQQATGNQNQNLNHSVAGATTKLAADLDVAFKFALLSTNY